ncbi:MAG: DUF2892 domain-containing protein [Candidatus Aenigmatarchaeota archaeon]
MKRNVGEKESVLRTVVGVILLLVGVAGFMEYTSYGAYTGTLSALSIIVGVVFVVTGLSRKCPLYSVMGK